MSAHGLSVLELRIVGGLLFVRSPDPAGAAAVEPGAWFGGKLPHGLMPAGTALEKWPLRPTGRCSSNIGSSLRRRRRRRTPTVSAVAWSVGQAEPGERLEFAAVSCDWPAPPRAAFGGERFIAPNQLLQWRPDGVSIMQVIPDGARPLPRTAARLRTRCAREPMLRATALPGCTAASLGAALGAGGRGVGAARDDRVRLCARGPRGRCPGGRMVSQAAASRYRRSRSTAAERPPVEFTDTYTAPTSITHLENYA